MKNANDHGEFQQQSTQRLDDEYTHIRVVKMTGG